MAWSHRLSPGIWGKYRGPCTRRAARLLPARNPPRHHRRRHRIHRSHPRRPNQDPGAKTASRSVPVSHSIVDFHVPALGHKKCSAIRHVPAITAPHMPVPSFAKILRLLTVVALMLVAPGGAKALAAPGPSIAALRAHGAAEVQDVFVRPPAGAPADPGQPLQVLLTLHGMGGNGADFGGALAKQADAR